MGPSERYFNILYEMTLQRTWIIMRCGFEPETTTSEVWSATNEPPHLHSICHFDAVLRIRIERIRIILPDPGP